MNQAEIESLYHNQHIACPNVRKAANLLHALMEAVNAQSDGWPYWHAPSRAAEPLMDLIQSKAEYSLYHPIRGTITAEELKKVVTPIKRMVTFQKKKQASFGNKFDFDVEAALRQ